MTSQTEDTFYLSKVDHAELAQVLLSFFGTAEWSGLNVQRYVKKDNPLCTLELHYGADRRIDNVVLGNLTDQDANEIRRTVKDALIDSQTVTIGREVCYSSNKSVTGCFRYKDMFHFTPLPDDAPRPPFVFGENPFTLEFQFVSSPHVLLNAGRIAAQVNKISRVLHLLTQGTIRAGSRYADFAWVVKHEPPDTITSEYRQIGYMYQDRSGEAGKYKAIDNIPPIEQEASEMYYDWRKGRMSHELTLPNNLEPMLDTAFGLKGADWERFYRACSWYYKAGPIWKVSHSASFIALITAIEALIDKKWEKCKECSAPLQVSDQDKCSKCGTPKYRVAKTFKTFLETYVPEVKDWPETKIIYQVRSDLAHGSTLFLRDLETLNMMALQGVQEDDLQRKVFHVVFGVIYNWLAEKARINHAA